MVEFTLQFKLKIRESKKFSLSGKSSSRDRQLRKVTFGNFVKSIRRSVEL